MDDFDQVALHAPPVLEQIDGGWQILARMDWLDCEPSKSMHTASDSASLLRQISDDFTEQQARTITHLPTPSFEGRLAFRIPGIAATDSRLVPYDKQRTTCCSCGLELLKKTLRRHIRTKHFDTPTLQCQACGKPCSRSDILKRHQKLHCTKGNNVACIYCGKSIGIRYLKYHFGTPGCIAARTALTTSAKSGVNPMLWQTARIEITGRFGADSFQDALTTCSYLLGTLERLLATNRDSNRMPMFRMLKSLGSEEPRVLTLRGLALSLMRHGTNAKDYLAVYLMWIIDLVLYVSGANSTRVHERHLAEVFRHYIYAQTSVDAYWDQMELYCRSAGEILNAVADLHRSPIVLSINRARAGELFGLPGSTTHTPLHECAMRKNTSCSSLLFVVPTVEEATVTCRAIGEGRKFIATPQSLCSTCGRSISGGTCTFCFDLDKGPTHTVCFGRYV